MREDERKVIMGDFGAKEWLLACLNAGQDPMETISKHTLTFPKYRALNFQLGTRTGH